jgi:hypothetical protein
MSTLSPGEQMRRDEMFRQGMLWCARCKQFHPVKDFRKYRPKAKPQTNYGYRYYCRRCELDQHQDRKEKHSQYFKVRNNQLKAQFAELAGGCCQRCGYKDYMAALDFHHVYPADKKYTPTVVIISGNLEKTWKELDKCCLLCHNCHVAYEAGLWRAEFLRRGDGLLGYTVGNMLPLDDRRYDVEKPPKLVQSSLPLFMRRSNGASQLGLFDGAP